MRQKIVEKLYDEVRNGDYTEDLRLKLRKQLDNLPFSEIGTIDSFCGKLIRENFEALGISPRIKQMDEAEADEAKRVTIDKIIAAEYDKGSEEFLQVVNKINSIADDARLSDIVLRLYNAANINPDPSSFKNLLRESATDNPDSVYGRIILDYYTDLAKDRLYFAEKAENELNFAGAPVYEDGYKQAIKTLDDISKITTPEEAKQVILSIPDVKMKKSEISDEDKAFVAEVRSSVKKIADGLYNDLFVDYSGYNVTYVKAFIDEILRLEESFETEYNAAKIAADKVDFIDLSRFAIRLLSDTERANAVAKKYSCIFVDEYQDINPLQESIITKLDRGNTFMVGDVKQSIYAFRNADSKIFSAKKKLYEKDAKSGCALQMTKSFRSTDNILEFADKVFGAVMSELHGGVNYAAESRFLPDKTIDCAKIADDVSVEIYKPINVIEERSVKGVYSVCGHKEGDAVEKAVYCEGTEVAKKIKELVNAAALSDEDKINYGDIAVLFKKRRGTEGFLRALTDNDIPFISDGFVADSGKKYIKQLICLLKVLDNSDNDVVLAGFLLSFFGGLTENQLAEIRAKNRNVSLLSGVKITADENTELGKKCAAALTFISYRRVRSAYVGVKELLDEIIVDTGYDAYVLSRKEGAEEYRAVKEFVAGVGRLDGRTDIQSYLSYLENTERRDTLPPADFGNAVRISTVHGSKGLEYPVVFLSCADSGRGVTNAGDILFDKDLGVGVKLYNEETRAKKPSLAYTALRLAARRRDADEIIRLMYVALTRAKKKLFITAKAVSGTAKKLNYPAPVIAAQSFLDLLLYAGAKDDDLSGLIGGIIELEPAETVKQEEYNASLTAPDTTYFDEISRVVNYVYGNKSATEIGLKYTVSQLNRLDDDTVYVQSVIKNDAVDMRRAGIAYHTVMENIDLGLTTLSEVKLFIEGLRNRGIMTAEDVDMVDAKKIFECINNPVVKEGLKGKYLREQSFMLRVKACEVADTEAADEILVQGAADLVFLGAKPAVVDFKFSTLPDDKLAEKYKKQLNLYKTAVETAFGVSVDKKLLYSFASGRFIEIK